jgi:hypothetical protein
MKRIIFAAAVFATIAHAAPDLAPWVRVNEQQEFTKPVQFNREVYFTNIDAGSMNLVGLKVDAIDAGRLLVNGQVQVLGPIRADTATLTIATIDAGQILSNGALQVLGVSTLAATTATTANATTSANTPFATVGLGVDAGSVRIANTYAPIAASQDGGTAAMTRIQFGMCVLSANSCAVTFNVAFSTIPQCLCSSVNGTAAACGVSATASTSAVTFKGANATDQIQWICIGDK